MIPNMINFNKVIFYTFVLGIIFLTPKIADAALLNATGILGQGLYTTSVANYPNPPGTVNARGFGGHVTDPSPGTGVTSSTLDIDNHRLFVADAANYRVLVFNLSEDSRIIDDTADYVLGQADFTTVDTEHDSINRFGNFLNICYDSKNLRLFVQDLNSNRVLVFNVNPETMTNGEDALNVLGQDNFNDATADHGHATPEADTLDHPDNGYYDTENDRYFVSDMWNHRVLIFNAAPGVIQNGMDAAHVLGQVNFTSSATFVHVPPITANGILLEYPTGITFDPVNDRLFVSDYNNSRIAIFYAPPDKADLDGDEMVMVIGQDDFTRSGWFVSGYPDMEKKIPAPDDMLGYDPITSRLMVADGRNRIMFYDTNPDTFQGYRITPAYNVLGQTAWSANTSQTSINRFMGPNSTASWDVENNRLFVKDRKSNRMIEYSMIHITNASFPVAVVGTNYSQQVNIENQQGNVNQTYSITSGSLPDGMTLDTSTGVISGTPSALSTTTFTVQATDNFNNPVGYFYDRKTYTLDVVPDTIAPILTNISNVSSYINDTTPTFYFTSDEARSISYSGCPAGLNVTEIGSNQVTFNTLSEGAHSCNITISDEAGNSTTLNYSFVIDTTAPTVTITSPPDGLSTSKSSVVLSGSILDTNPSSTLTINGVNISNPANFSATVTLSYGSNAFTLIAKDAAGNETVKTITVIRRISSQASIGSQSIASIIQSVVEDTTSVEPNIEDDNRVSSTTDIDTKNINQENSNAVSKLWIWTFIGAIIIGTVAIIRTRRKKK